MEGMFTFNGRLKQIKLLATHIYQHGGFYFRDMVVLPGSVGVIAVKDKPSTMT